MDILDLSGNWNYAEDIDDSGLLNKYYETKLPNTNFILPGSTCDNHIGHKQEYYDELVKEAVRAPREKFEYIAPLWLQKEVIVPEEFEGKCLKLFMERVNIASELWIDGKKIDRQIIELSTPHIYNLTGKLTAGKHIFTLRIDNRNLLNFDVMASGYSVDTQGYWNGIIGKIELQCEQIFHLENIQVYPKDNGIDIKLTETSDVYFPYQRRNAQIELLVIAPDKKVLKSKRYSVKLFNSKQVEHFSYEIENIQYWNEFTPNLYTLHVKYICENSVDEKSVLFGMRTIKAHNKKILLNDKPIALRGTIDCAIYPLTGYPPMDIEVWRKNFSIIKSYGLNHVRFHAWCPPEGAFCAADELGIYISVEMPLWLNRDACSLEVGEASIHYSYYIQEAINISKTYGNHPCFVMFSNGNENMGDFELLEDIIIQIKAYDNRRIYTLTTNFDHPILPCEDYLCACEAGGNKIRIQDIHDIIAEDTYYNYNKAVEDASVPIISFEIGQYCVYPDVDIISKYTGNMLPVNFDAIKKNMIKKNVYHRLNEYIKASGNLAVKLYKEDIEAALRTKDFGGFELLSLCDYTGQNTATVGILDVLFESKGLISPKDFRRFCNSVVPLFKSKRIFKNTEALEAELDLYNYGEKQIENPVFELKIYNENELFYKTVTTDKKINIMLNEIYKPSQLKVELAMEGYTNSWNIFVFADSKICGDVQIIKTKDELKNIIQEGGNAILTATCLKNPIEGSFIPVFWSPAHFPSQKPCGAIIDNKHSIFSNFPTEEYPDYQWKRLLDNSKGMDISTFGKGFCPIIETIPNFMDNIPSSPLFEMKIGNANLLFCGFDLNAKAPEVSALKFAIYSYIQSDKFKPNFKMDLDLNNNLV